MQNIPEIVATQRHFFSTGQTKPVTFRKEQLQKLKKALLAHEQEIYDAFKIDLNKSPFETYETEIGIVLQEINDMLRNLQHWAKPQKVKTPIMCMPGTSYTYADPYGCVLIMSPWNYPLQLTLAPLVGAIGGGNCAIIKPSNYAPHVSTIIKKILDSCFSSHYVATVLGGRQENQHLLEQKFDYIFFTGGTTVGKIVMEAAAKHITPITLELGGKSPCIVDKTADIDMAALRLAWGKIVNAGQTCVAPDYLYVHKDVKDALISKIKQQWHTAFGESPEQNSQYPKIITQHHFERINNLIHTSGTIITGGQSNSNTLQIAPTLLDDVTWESPIMREEIFGPVLPILTYEHLDEVVEAVTSQPKPLALYLFTTDKTIEKRVLQDISFGGGCINEVIIHMVNPHMPFGGVGQSGMGGYHGKYSFDTFTHKKSVLKKSNLFEPPIRYAPYTDKKFSSLRKLLK